MTASPTLPGYPDAVQAALDLVTPLPNETVSLDDAAGRILRTPVVADRDQPPFHRAQMDGYAMRTSDIAPGVALPVVGTVAAGMSPDVAVPVGSCVKIATGAPLPDDVDTVIQHEHSDRCDPVTFDLDTIDAGHAVHPRGADARAGDVLLDAGRRLGPIPLGLAAAVGQVTLDVASRPRVTILTSGDEVRPPHEDVATHQIRNSNGPMLTRMLRRFGAGTVTHDHVVDDLDTTTGAVGVALDSSDLVITVGGVSAGECDFFPAAFATHEVEITLRGAQIQPGKPIAIGRRDGTIVVALPGNPVSALVCANLFVRPIIGRMTGWADAMRWRSATLGDSVRPNPRRQAFRPAVQDADGMVRVPRWAGSGDLAHAAPTSGVLALPVQADTVPAGTSLPFLPWIGGV